MAADCCYNPAMKTLFPALLLLLTALVTPALHGADGAELYTATVPVADHSEAERTRALRAGLAEVVVKLTGSAASVASSEVRSLLARASSYVVEFGYVELPLAEQGLGLSVKYSRAELDAFLRQEGLPVWPPQRAALLVWVLREAGDQPQTFVTRDEDEGLYAHLDRAFAARGLPVRYPLYDLEDQLGLPVATAWSLAAEELARASVRYGANQWLVLRCYQSASDHWRLAWVLGRGEQTSLDSLEGADLDALLQQVVDGAVDSIAAGQAYIPTLTAGRVALEVSGVDGFASYTGMLDTLQGLSMVRSVTIAQVVGERISLFLDVEGSEKVLLDALALSEHFNLPEQPGAPGQALSVVWRQPTSFR